MEKMEAEFNEKHKPNFERIIPNKELEELRVQIRQNF